MRRMFRRAALAAAVLLTTALPIAAAPVTITFLHFPDGHGAITRQGPRQVNLQGTVGGLAKVATLVGLTRGADPNVLVTHGGDLFVGNLTFNATLGIPELQIIRQIGFDAMAVGNHEFDWGSVVLASALSQAYGTATLPLLSANLDLSAKPELSTWIQPSVMKDVGGLKVGIFGMTVPGNPLSQPDPVVIQGADDPQVILQIAGTQAATLRASGADVVVCLSHLGLAYDQAVAANVPGIDVILGAHDHKPLAEPLVVPNAGGQTIIVQPDTFYREAGKLRITVDAGVVSLAGYEAIPLDETIPDEPTVAGAVAAVQDAVRAMYGDVYDTKIATADRDILLTWDPAARERDTGMGNLVGDAIRKQKKTQIALVPNGFMSAGLHRGPLNAADVFAAVAYGYDEHTSYGFHIATFDITGEQLLKALEVTLGYLDQTQDYFLQVAGMSFMYDPRKPAGQRVIEESVRVGGKRLQRGAVYSAAVDEGTAMMIPVMGVSVTNLKVTDDVEYLAVRDYVTQCGTVSSAPEGRILDVSVPADSGGGACFAALGGEPSYGWAFATVAVLIGLAGVRRLALQR
jgi:5'-nucleotidase